MTIRALTIVVFAVACLCVSVPSSAEPRFLSKQYNRCSSCHYAESGGGLLTPYGRSLSGQELSSFWRQQAQPAAEGTVSGEEAFLYDLFGDRLGPVGLGVSLRPSFLHYEQGTFSDNRNILMNADVAGAYRGHGLTAYGEVGRKPETSTEEAGFYSREHWVSYAAPRGIGIKGGRYMPAYGVHFSDHTSFNRNDLGFDKHDQVYGVEVSHTSTRTLTQVTVSPGRADSLVDDDGYQAFTTTGRLQVDLGSAMVLVGSGLYRGESTNEAHSGVAGGAFGFAPTRRLTFWTQGDAHIEGGGLGTSFVFANETAWEVVRGVWLKLSPQGRTGTDARPGVFRWAVGASLLPRTHWNVDVTFYRDRTEDVDDALNTFLAQLHLYL